MADLAELILSYYYYMMPIIAVAAAAFYIQTTRKITDIVCFHHRGGTRSEHRARVAGGNISFTPYPKSKPIIVRKEAPPETMVKGMKTLRVHDVVEEAGKTVPYIDQKTGEKKTRTEPSYSNKNIHFADKAPKFAAAAASLSLFQEVINIINKNLPKTKGDIMLMLLYIVMGVAMGFPTGMLLVKMGLI